MEAGVFQASAEERAVFQKLHTATLKTTLCSADTDAATIPDAASHVWAGPLRHFNRRLRMIRFSRFALGEWSDSTAGTLSGTGAARPHFVAYQVDEGPPSDELSAKMLSILRADLAVAQVENPSVIAERCWDYFPHFVDEDLFPKAGAAGEAVRKGGPWAILELQGKNGLVFAGSSACFESIIDVLAYNELLFSRLCK